MKGVVPASLLPLESQRNLVSLFASTTPNAIVNGKVSDPVIHKNVSEKMKKGIRRDVRGSIILLEEQCFEFSGA